MKSPKKSLRNVLFQTNTRHVLKVSQRSLYTCGRNRLEKATLAKQMPSPMAITMVAANNTCGC